MTRWLMVVACLVAGVRSPTAQGDGPARMQAWSKALGVECSHCHVDGRSTDASKPTFEFAGRMARMVTALNDGPLRGLRGVTCWTCHRGQAIPARLPRQAWETIRANHAGEFDQAPDHAVTMSVYAASLGVDCEYCHDRDRSLNTKAAKAMVAKMLPVFDEIPRHFDGPRRPTTQCFMCHQGKIAPER